MAPRRNFLVPRHNMPLYAKVTIEPLCFMELVLPEIIISDRIIPPCLRHGSNGKSMFLINIMSLYSLLDVPNLPLSLYFL